MSNMLAIHGGEKTRREPFHSWPVYGIEEEDALKRVLHSGAWGRIDGRETEKFEQAFAKHHDAKYGIAVVNGSIALRIALMALGIDAGDEVIVPAYTFLATATTVVECNAVPVFVDIAPDSYNLDPDKIEAAITERTKAIVPVHFGGLPADMDRIMAIAKKHNLIVLEDAAHGHGAEYKGRKVGSLGDIAAFSFQASKNMTAGEGGIITTNSEMLGDVSRSIHNCGRSLGGAWYGHERIGGNYRLTEWQSAVLACQLARLEEQAKTRDENGRYLNEKLAQIPGLSPLPRGHGETRHAYHLYIFRFNEQEFGIPRAAFLSAIGAEGIGVSGGYAIPLYEQPVFAQRQFGPYAGAAGYVSDLAANAANCPVTERICRTEACWIGQSTMLGSRADMDDIVTAAEKVYAHRSELQK